MSELKIGDRAPDFEGLDNTGKRIALSDFRGHKLILFFYPGDFTPICTMEACNLRDNYAALRDKGFDVLGVSADTVSKHGLFVDKHRLPFRLLADLKREVITKYGAWGRKGIWRLFSFGVRRFTFIIDEEGIIIAMVRNVKSRSHAQQLMKILETIGEVGKSSALNSALAF